MAEAGRTSPENTILYLRPIGSTVSALDFEDNKARQYQIVSPQQRTNRTAGPISNRAFRSRHPGRIISRGSGSGTTAPDLVRSCHRVFRLGCNSVGVPAAEGFIVGSGPHSYIRLPPLTKPQGGNTKTDYFRIHYKLRTGALLVTVIVSIQVGAVVLEKDETLVLMPGAIISRGEDFEFLVQFPNVGNLKQHELNYRYYASGLGATDTQYLDYSLLEPSPIGALYRRVELIGRGGFGSVYKALNIRNGEFYAIKMVDGEDEMAITEVNIMSNNCHENIIQYENSFRFDQKICIVMEFAGQDLFKFLKTMKSRFERFFLSLRCIQSIGRQVLSALEYLHRRGVTHRDVKPQNLLVAKWHTRTQLATIKLADFGFASLNSQHTTICGTEGYMAPEIYREYRMRGELQSSIHTGTTINHARAVPGYDKSVDIWALGKVLRDLVNTIPSSISSDCREIDRVNNGLVDCLIDRMMQSEPRMRPTASGCLNHPWMTQGAN